MPQSTDTFGTNREERQSGVEVLLEGLQRSGKFKIIS